ncbi:Thioesterase/thiol ester dehydrase-isomerase [Xylaria sp. FL0064]|nr:Thioesterase/thiol ester dehydrase-isomerase [Xylaria sp. FL0064]
MSNKAQLSASLEAQTQYFISHGISILERPSIITFIPSCRGGPDLSAEPHFASQERFFSRLLNNATAIPRLVGFYENPFHNSTSTSPVLPSIVESMSFILELNDGLRGHNETVQGGMICSILDEAMTEFLIHGLFLNRQAKANGLIPKDAEEFRGGATAGLNVKFLKPLLTPAVVLVKATLERKEGRKTSPCAVIADPYGKEYATCTSLVIELIKPVL